MTTSTAKSLAAIALLAGCVIPQSASGRQQDAAPDVGLHMAVLTDDLAAIRQHIAAGSDLNARDAFGSTPLIVAATFGRAGAAKALIEGGADLNLAGPDGGTALHTAAFLGRIEIVQALLDAGADKYLRDNAGNTPQAAVAAPFDEVRGIYDRLAQGLAPLGLRLDDEQIKAARPRIAEMLRPRPEELDSVEFAPSPGGDWAVSTPAKEGVDRALLADLYLEASAMDNVHGILVAKNGRLIGERYLNEGAPDRKELLQSATKSYTSALVGLALEKGCLSSVDQKMMDFFPELSDQITDHRKDEITIRQLLEMRSGYPWEETDATYWDAMVYGEFVPLVVRFPLVTDPGTAFHYSNLSSQLLGIIVARACGTDLKSFAEETLFSPLGVHEGAWIQDRDGYYVSMAELRFTLRDMAKFGQLYLDGGEYRGKRVVPAEWVEASLRPYSKGMYDSRWMGDESNYLGPYLHDVGYGYQWWSGRSGDHGFDFAWGHGGQLIVLLHDLDMVVVAVTDPYHLQHDEESWRHERATLTLVGKFIQSLPG
jgi:CubicO group peptidase (beta-lactamase class C family)